VPPRHYGPWERVVSLLTEGLVARGVKVTLFATADSLTRARLVGVCPRPYSEDPSIDPKVWECLAVYLSPAANSAGPVGSRPHAVNRTVMTSQTGFTRPPAGHFPYP